MFKIFLISGPSGSGQDAVIEEAIRQGLKCTRVITTTTRLPRSTESERHPYHFVNESEFEQKIAQGEMLEQAQYNGHYYGVTRADLDEAWALNLPVLWKVDHQGVRNIKNLFPEACAILIKPLSLQELKERLIKRGQNSTEEIAARLKIASVVLAETEIYDFIIENIDGQLEKAGQKLKEIVENTI